MVLMLCCEENRALLLGSVSVFNLLLLTMHYLRKHKQETRCLCELCV